MGQGHNQFHAGQDSSPCKRISFPAFCRYLQKKNHDLFSMIKSKLLRQFLVEPGSGVNRKDYVSDWTNTDEARELGTDAIKERAAEILRESREQLAKAREMLYAADTHPVLIVLQAMDAAGKDGAIRHVMAGVNPQGCQVSSFKKPSAVELDHNFLWRSMKALPERGRIGIFNRSCL
jgi:polyphosphate kinase 2 (PPK2 family)